MGEINYLRDSATGVTYDLMPKDGGITEAKLSDELQEKLQELELGIGSPLVASTAAEMTDTDKIYVYTGSETGYTSGNWYYYNGSAWTSGGVYNSMALETDTTLQVSGAAADAKVVGDQVSQLKEDLTKITPADVVVISETVAEGTTTDNSAWNVSGPPTSGSNYKHVLYDVTDRVDDNVIVTGVSWGANWPLISCYSEDDTLIYIYGTSGATNWRDEAVTIPKNTSYVIINGSKLAAAYPVSMKYRKRTGETQQTINEGFADALQNYIPKLYTLQDAFVAWMNGEKFPIAFYGDSTTDGWRTTGWTANTLGSDHTTGYLYTDVLQANLRECCNNNILRVYNAGFTGRTLAWALANFEAEFINSGVAYSDVKMIGISFGINDAIGNKTQYTAFKNDLIALIKKCIANDIQPFLVTTQATYEEDLASRNETIANHSYANQIKKEVAKKYGLELIDTEAHTGRYLTWSTNKILDIIPDTCHFADIGHKFEGGMYFWQIVPRTIYVDENDTKITPYTVGITSDINWRDGNYSMLFANAQRSNKYKTKIEYNKNNTTDIKMLDFWVYLNRPMIFTPFFGTLTTQYMIVDGVTITPSADLEPTGVLDMGLHHIVMMSGTNETAIAYGGAFTTE